MGEPGKIVFIVDDDEAVREALRLLVSSAGLDVEAFGSAAEFFDAYDPGRAGCLLLDVRMPGMNGLEVQEKLGSMHTTLPIIFLTGHADVSLAVQAMHAGAFHFFEKPFDDEELLERIRLALEQDARQRDKLVQRSAILDRLDGLTPREKQVMTLVVQGNANKVIAQELGISERTVEIHRSRVMEKMKADSLAHLVRMGMQVRDGSSR